MNAEPIPEPVQRALAAEQFRQVFRRHAAGVAVITLPGATPIGFTATSVVSLSAAPPLLSFNVSQDSAHYPAFQASRRAAVHILKHDQQGLATIFATGGIDRFARIHRWTRDRHGLPIIADVLAWMAIEIRHRLVTGDHTLVVGEIVDAEYTDGQPLIYHQGRYTELSG